MIERLTVLENGIKVATCAMPGVMSVSAMWRLEGGASAEPPELAGAANGLAHVLEHCVADFDRLARPINARGGVFNAETSCDHIGMEMHVMAGSGLYMLRQMLEHGLRAPNVSPAVVKREIRRVKQELRECWNDPDSRAYERAYAALFPGQPRGLSVGGTVSAVKNLTPETLTSYFNLLRQGQNLSIVAAGGIDHDSTVRIVRDVLGDLPRGEGLVIPPSRFRSGEARAHERDSDSVQLNLFLPSCKNRSSDQPAYVLANYLLGGSSFSYLHDEVSHKRGYVYGVTSHCDGWHNDGMIHIATSTASGTAQKLINRLARSVYTDFAKTLTPTALHEAKMATAFDYLSTPEGPADWTERALSDLPRYGRVLSLQETLAQFSTVTLDQLKAAAADITSRMPFVFAQGDVKTLELSEPFAEALARRPVRCEL